MTKADHIRELIGKGMSAGEVQAATGYSIGQITETAWRLRYPDKATERTTYWREFSRQPHVAERKRLYANAYKKSRVRGASREQAAAAGRAATAHLVSR